MRGNNDRRGRGRGRPLRDNTDQRGAGSDQSGPGPAAAVPSQALEKLSLEGAIGVSVGRGRGRSQGRARNWYELHDTRPRDGGDRPVSKLGRSGESISLTSNYLAFKCGPDARLLQYRVDFSLDSLSTAEKKSVVRGLKTHLPVNVFDGTVMYTHSEIYPHKQKDRLVLSGAKRTGQESKPVEVTFKLTSEVKPTQWQYLQIYNIIVRMSMQGLGLTLIHRDFYDMRAGKAIPDYKLEVYPGYKTSVRQHEHALLMCAEISHKVVRNETVLQQANFLLAKGVRFDKIEADLLGSIVMTRYNNRTYRVDGVDVNINPASTFRDKSGRSVTYAEYFKERYGIELKEEKQFMLRSMPKDRDVRGGRTEDVLLPPEVCYMTGLTDETRKDFKAMTAMAEYLNMGPVNRAANVERFAQRLCETAASKEVLDEWDMKLVPKLVSVPGRVLDTVPVVRKNDTNNQYRNADWSNLFRAERGRPAVGMHVGMNLDNWVFLYPKHMQRNVESMLEALKFVSPGLGIRVGEPKWWQIPAANSDAAIVTALKSILALDKHFIVIAIPSDKGTSYATIKRFLLCRDDPVPNQVLTGKTLFKMDKHRTFAVKILLQISTKRGGEPWIVNIPSKNLMVVGFDTYHDTKRKGSSYGALVSSLNGTLSRYFSAVTPHANNEEMSSHVPSLFEEGLKRYVRHNKAMPANVIFFRFRAKMSMLNCSFFSQRWRRRWANRTSLGTRGRATGGRFEEGGHRGGQGGLA